MRLNSILLIITTFISTDLNCQTILDRTVAFVDKNIILQSDIDNLKQEKGKEVESFDECNTLKNLVLNELLIVKSQRDSIQITQEEIDNELDRRMEYFIGVFGSEDKLERYYNKSISELKTMFRYDVENNIRIEKTKNSLLRNVDPSPKQVKDYFNSLHVDSIPYYNSEIQMAEIIFVPPISRESKRLLKQKASQIREKLANKESEFATQAIIYSDDPGSATNGGELGWISKGQMVPEFEQASFSLPIMQISELIESKYGYHIIQVLDRKEDKSRVRHILLSHKPTDEELRQTKLMADSIRTKILGGRMTFQKAVELYSEDPYFKSNGGILINFDTRSTFFEPGQIDPDLAPKIATMKVGDITEPEGYRVPGGKIGYRIVQLISESKPHKANLETDYFKIKENCTLSLRQEATDKWFEEYKNSNFIKISDDYISKCPNLEGLNSKY